MPEDERGEFLKDKVKSYAEQYKKMSPKELNGELLAIYRQIPRTELVSTNEEIDNRIGEILTDVKENGKVTVSSEEIFGADYNQKLAEAVQKRGHSEHKDVLRERLQVLLRFSHLSSFFQNYVLNRFDADYVMGDYIEKPNLPVPYPVLTSRDLLDLETADIGGIFDPERAREIERFAYQTQVAKDEHFRNHFSRMGRQVNPLQLKSEQQIRRGWIKQFFKKHGEAP